MIFDRDNEYGNMPRVRTLAPSWSGPWTGTYNPTGSTQGTWAAGKLKVYEEAGAGFVVQSVVTGASGGSCTGITTRREPHVSWRAPGRARAP